MNIVQTSGTDPNFLTLCDELDAFLSELAGGSKKRQQYISFNQSCIIKDAIVLYDGSVPVGSVGLHEYKKNIAEIKHLFIRPPYRGRGLSYHILTAVETLATKQGYIYAILETGRALGAAFHLYTSTGYQVIPNYAPYCGMRYSVCMGKLLFSNNVGKTR